MFNELESKYEGMVDGVYEGWFIVMYQSETSARVMWSCMKDEEKVVSIVVEDWKKFADGTWGAFDVVDDFLGYEYTTAQKDIYYYNKYKNMYSKVEQKRTDMKYLIDETIIALHWEMENYIDADDHMRASYLGNLIDKLEEMIKEVE